MKKMENGETVIGMLCHVIIALRLGLATMRRNIQRWRRNIRGNIGGRGASPNMSGAVWWQSIGLPWLFSVIVHWKFHWTGCPAGQSPDLSLDSHWKFHQFSALKIGVFQSGVQWESSQSPPESVGECKDLEQKITRRWGVSGKSKISVPGLSEEADIATLLAGSIDTLSVSEPYQMVSSASLRLLLLSKASALDGIVSIVRAVAV